MHFQHCVHCHKWLCSAPGSAFLYARPEVQHLVEPLVVSWGWNRVQPFAPAGSPDPADERRDLAIPPEQGGKSRFVDENEWQGTRDPAAFLTVPAAIQFHGQSPEHDWPRVRAECHACACGACAGELLREARRRIEALTSLPAICPDSPDWYAQMAAFPLPACDAAALQRRLYDEYRVKVPIIEWGGRQLVRVSVQGYNTREEMEALVRALADLLPKVS